MTSLYVLVHTVQYNEPITCRLWGDFEYLSVTYWICMFLRTRKWALFYMLMVKWAYPPFVFIKSTFEGLVPCYWSSELIFLYKAWQSNPWKQNLSFSSLSCHIESQDRVNLQMYLQIAKLVLPHYVTFMFLFISEWVLIEKKKKHISRVPQEVKIRKFKLQPLGRSFLHRERLLLNTKLHPLVKFVFCFYTESYILWMCTTRLSACIGEWENATQSVWKSMVW